MPVIFKMEKINLGLWDHNASVSVSRFYVILWGWCVSSQENFLTLKGLWCGDAALTPISLFKEAQKAFKEAQKTFKEAGREISLGRSLGNLTKLSIAAIQRLYCIYTVLEVKKVALKDTKQLGFCVRDHPLDCSMSKFPYTALLCAFNALDDISV